MSRRPTPARILYLDNSFTFGGAITSLSHMIRGLDRERYKPIIVSGQPSPYLEELFSDAVVRTVSLKLPWVHNRIYRAAISTPGLRDGIGRSVVSQMRTAYWLLRHDLPRAFRYARMARRDEAALLHANNNVESQFPELLAARMAGRPAVVHNRSFQRPGRGLRRLLPLVDHHLAISTAIRDNLLELGARPEKISVVHDGVDIDAFRSAARPEVVREEFGIREDDILFGIFGRVTRWKGTMEFVQAAVGVLEQVPRARAFIVGDASDRTEAYFQAVDEFVRQSGLGDRIILTGYRDDVPSLMALMDVVVHASVDPEPFGMVLIEAMALRKPVVATRGGGPDDIVVEDETGLLVAPGSSAELREAILHLLRDAPRRERMGGKGLERARSRFSSERYADDVMSIYDRVLRERGYR